jgi:WD40 repeat protein
VVTGGDDYTARVWESGTGKPVGTPIRQLEKIADVAVSPDGTIILTVGMNGSARLWERATGKQVGLPLPAKGGLRTGRFAPDGRTFFTGSREGIVRSWTAPVALEGKQEDIWLWLHAYTGLQLDPAGAVVPLQPAAWRQSFAEWCRMR